MDASVGRTILEQLGGRRFVIMTGAKNFMSTGQGLIFSLPGSGGFTKNGINRVSISLNVMDLYDLTFSRVRGLNQNNIEEKTNVYAEDLKSTFTEVTGLVVSL